MILRGMRLRGGAVNVQNESCLGSEKKVIRKNGE